MAVKKPIAPKPAKAPIKARPSSSKTATKKQAPAPKKTAVTKNTSPAVADAAKFLKYVTEGCAKAGPRFEQDLRALFRNPEQLTAANLAHIYVLVRKAAEAWFEAGQTLVATVDQLKEFDVPQAFEREGITSFNTDTGSRVTISQRYYASIIKGQKEAAFGWLRSNQLGDIITETVNASTLSATGKLLIEQGKDLPEEIFSCHFKASTSMTGGKKYKSDNSKPAEI